jgi:hypothetical protein
VPVARRLLDFAGPPAWLTVVSVAIAVAAAAVVMPRLLRVSHSTP